MSHLVLNIPHCSRVIPEELKADILLSDDVLKDELDLMTDTDTDKLYTGYDSVVAKVSRLVCDTERFLDIDAEPMEKRGMGAVYTQTATGKQLRLFDADKRQKLLEKYYHPYHDRLNELVTGKLEKYGKCLIIDCHSYSNDLPFIESYEDVCIGFCDYHTDMKLVETIAERFRSHGYSVGLNKPFSGTIVPLTYYGKNDRVQSVMFEINKQIYTKSQADFDKVKKIIDELLASFASSA